MDMDDNEEEPMIIGGQPKEKIGDQNQGVYFDNIDAIDVNIEENYQKQQSLYIQNFSNLGNLSQLRF